MKDNTHTQECKACEQVIALPAPDPRIEYCLTCTEEVNAWHDANTPTEEELDAWGDLWESQEKLNHETAK